MKSNKQVEAISSMNYLKFVMHGINHRTLLDQWVLSRRLAAGASDFWGEGAEHRLRFL